MLQDLEDKNYKKITSALIEAVINRPLFFLIGKTSRLYPYVTVLKKLYILYHDCKYRINKFE